VQSPGQGPRQGTCAQQGAMPRCCHRWT
jgi:hypothetical protein